MCIEPVASFLSFRQIDLIRANVLGSQHIRRLSEVTCEQRNLLEVRCLGMRRQIPYLHILRHSLSKNSHGKLLCDREQLQRAALHDVAIGLPQKCRTMGWLRRCQAALPRSGFVQQLLSGAPNKTDFGAAWKKTARETQREYLSVKLDDPSFPAPIYASLVEAEGGEGYNLIWSRRNGD